MGDSLYGIRRPERSQGKQPKSIQAALLITSASSSPFPPSRFLILPSGRVARRARSLLLLLVSSFNTRFSNPRPAMHSFLSLVFLLATLLASRVYALDITVGGTLGNVSATDFLNITNSSVVTTCSSTCDPVKDTLAACTDTACFCNDTTIGAVASCEQCMFNALIAGNLQQTDPREGGQVALTAYGTACGLNATEAKTLTTLSLPADWDGPFGQGLSPVATAFVLMIALMLGTSSIYVVCTM
ncbi:hypothetical protein C8Q72DRAFT_838302 [Fomitopsis betulina]|nr:hypothetical protein C8Q72DRAFT_838302 [Fomitopsis betulina]